MEVPFFDLKREYANIKDDIDGVLKEVLKSSSFVAGEFVQKFENSFSSFCGVKYAIGVTCGTTAVYLALKSLGIGKDDEVITTTNTFMATAEAIDLTGARPVFVDIDKDSHNINPKSISRFIEQESIWDKKTKSFVDRMTKKRIKAIIPVHLYGQMADMKPIMEIADKYGLYVVEDSAQAVGALYKTDGSFRKAGSFGEISAFSFYPSKNLGAYGNGGAVVTDNARLAGRVRMLINHGQKKKYHHNILGWNFKMNGFQGAILHTKLKYLDEWNEKRREHSALYNKLFNKVDGVTTQREMGYGKHIYHLYVVRVKRRDELQRFLKSKGIGTAIHYPIPLHLQKPFHYLGYKEGSFPVAEKYAEEIISLPMFPELTEDEIRYVAANVKKFVEKSVGSE